MSSNPEQSSQCQLHNSTLAPRQKHQKMRLAELCAVLMAKILLIEKDQNILQTVSVQLRRDNHEVEFVSSALEARHWLENGVFDLVIIDSNLPDEPVLHLLRWYRRKGNLPVIILSERGSIDDRTEGLDAGADDFLIHPFSLRELSSRVRALLRRPGLICDYHRIGDWVLNPTTLSAHFNGRQVKLRPREFALLEFLARHPGEIFKANELVLRVWPSNSEVTAEALRTTVKRIRQQLGDRIIEVIAGAGYKLGSSESEAA
jgi:DNA-binding response OmpR family regulator